MRKQFLILCIILFVQSFTLVSLHSVNTGFDQEGTTDKLIKFMQNLAKLKMTGNAGLKLE